MDLRRLKTALVGRAPGRAGLAMAAAFALTGCEGTIRDPGMVMLDDAGHPIHPDGGAGPVACTTTVDPGAAYMRRLTNSEYDRTLRDLTGSTGSPSAHFPDTPYKAGYDNNIDELHISPTQAEDYMDAAETVTHAIMADATRRQRVMGCDPATATDRAACIRSFVTSFGRRAFRRALSSDEVTTYTTLATHASGTGPYDGAALALEGILQSPNFLFRVEVGAPDSTHAGFNRLTGVEMASRLAYLLWGSTPDDSLLDRAEAGQLDTADGVADTARTMLADPRSREAMQEFYGQWLRLYDLEQAAPNPNFTAWNDHVLAAMEEENRRFVDDFIWTDGAHFLDMLTANYTYVNSDLASLYGQPALPAGQTWVRAVFPAGTTRGGLLTQGAFLAGHARPDSDSPTRRGRWVREVLLCQDMPAPPADVPPIGATLTGQSQRQRLEAHRSNPACAGCHELMDPVGFGFEEYDAIGRFQTHDPSGAALTGAGQLLGYDPDAFTGPLELEAKLRDVPAVSDCVVQQVFRFAFGRVSGDGDTCTIANVQAGFRASNQDFRAMVVSLVTSDSFRYVHPGAPEAGGGS